LSHRYPRARSIRDVARARLAAALVTLAPLLFAFVGLAHWLPDPRRPAPDPALAVIAPPSSSIKVAAVPRSEPVDLVVVAPSIPRAPLVALREAEPPDTYSPTSPGADIQALAKALIEEDRLAWTRPPNDVATLAPILPESRAPVPVVPTPPEISAPPPSLLDRVVAAAIEHTAIEVTYDHRYYTIAYPMGDVPAHVGVCSDVIVRAYRAVGIDLQELVHLAKVGIGDRNIDHRRVSVLNRFFARFGEALPISPYPEDYRPGDIVVYDVPWGRTSKFHIAIVSDRIGPTLRPLVIHNRGYGHKLEDALFHKRIIGRYRYIGPPTLQAGHQNQPTIRAEKAGSAFAMTASGTRQLTTP
jgi:hypothetical protein